MTVRAPAPPASRQRPIGELHSFLQDVAARGFAPRGILDVGAHKGSWTRGALAVFPATPAIVIEPLDEMEPYLQALTAELPPVYYVKAGAGRQSGVRLLTLYPDLSGSSFLPAAAAWETQRPTPLRSIDEILAERPDFHPDLVKLDTQGFELEALAGGATLFGRTELFIVETLLYEFLPGMPLTRQVIAFLAERGYEIYDVAEWHRRPRDGALAQIDFAFVRRDGPFRTSHAWD